MLTHSIAEEALYFCILNDTPAKDHFISIEFKVKDNQLLAEIKNNGLIRELAVELQRSKGLQNGDERILEKRLELMNYKNADRINVSYGFDTNEKEKVNRSLLIIPQT